MNIYIVIYLFCIYLKFYRYTLHKKKFGTFKIDA